MGDQYLPCNETRNTQKDKSTEVALWIGNKNFLHKKKNRFDCLRIILLNSIPIGITLNETLYYNLYHKMNLMDIAGGFMENRAQAQRRYILRDEEK